MERAERDDAEQHARPPAPVRMGRVERRAQLLTLAAGMFARRGYHHISMDDIAEHAGVTKPVLYRHFPSKLDLYLAVVDGQGADLVAAVRVELLGLRPGADPDSIDLVDAVVRGYRRYADRAGASASLLFESDVLRDDVARAHVMGPHDAVTAAVAATLRRGEDPGADHADAVGRACTVLARAALLDDGPVVPLLALRGLQPEPGTVPAPASAPG